MYRESPGPYSPNEPWYPFTRKSNKPEDNNDDYLTASHVPFTLTKVGRKTLYVFTSMKVAREAVYHMDGFTGIHEFKIVPLK